MVAPARGVHRLGRRAAPRRLVHLQVEQVGDGRGAEAQFLGREGSAGDGKVVHQALVAPRVVHVADPGVRRGGADQAARGLRGHLHAIDIDGLLAAIVGHGHMGPLALVRCHVGPDQPAATRAIVVGVHGPGAADIEVEGVPHRVDGPTVAPGIGIGARIQMIHRPGVGPDPRLDRDLVSWGHRGDHVIVDEVVHAIEPAGAALVAVGHGGGAALRRAPIARVRLIEQEPPCLGGARSVVVGGRVLVHGRTQHVRPAARLVALLDLGLGEPPTVDAGLVDQPVEVTVVVGVPDPVSRRPRCDRAGRGLRGHLGAVDV